jgi:hypothetical protein
MNDHASRDKADPIDKQDKPDSIDPQHYTRVAKLIAEGRVVPFLGAGVNLWLRPEGAGYQFGQYLPSGAELALYFAERFDYERAVKGYAATQEIDLLRVSAYVALMQGEGRLYEELRDIFNADYPWTEVHTFFATLREKLRAKGFPRIHDPSRPIHVDPSRRQHLIITTNYDDLLERAFVQAGEPFHVLSYIAEERDAHRGRFRHWPSAGGDPVVVDRPDTYEGLQDDTTIILKIHGAVDRASDLHDSYVITEDDYIDYLTRTDIAKLLPNPLPAKLKQSHFLFLGYSLRDWNLRAILHRLSRERRPLQSWAIVKNPEDLERRFWARHRIDIMEVDLGIYVAEIGKRLDELPTPSNSPAGKAAD